MRKIVTVAVATTIAGSSLFFSAAVASADAPTCPPGWTDQSLKRGDDFADKNDNRSICELNIGVKKRWNRFNLRP